MLSINKPTVRDLRIDLALQYMTAGEKIAMVTLVGVEGRSPYPVGTQMLVKQSGEYSGQLTGGCAEQAIAEQAVLAIQTGKNQLQRYGLNSPFFDIQLPCGSGIDVHLDVQTPLSEYESLNKELQLRNTVKKTLKTSDCSVELMLFPTPRVVIVGEGAILCSLAKLAKLSGFESLIISAAERDKKQLSSDEISVVSSSKAGLLENLTADSYTAFVSLFHEHDKELPLLAKALSQNWFYIGALGSRQTHQERKHALELENILDTKIRAVKGPVGLNIQAQTPSQIAISILADMIAHLPKAKHVKFTRV